MACRWCTSGSTCKASRTQLIVENNFLKVKEDKSIILPSSKPKHCRKCNFQYGTFAGKIYIIFITCDATPEKKHVLNGGTQAIMEVAFGLATIGKMNLEIACLNSAIPIFEDAYPDIKNLNIFVGYEMLQNLLKHIKTNQCLQLQ